MTLEHLIYTPQDIQTSDERPNTFVLMVDQEMYDQRKRHGKSIPLADVVESFVLYKYEHPGRQGKLSRPNKREIQEVFGTTRDDDIAEFMLEHGTTHGTKGAKRAGGDRSYEK
jgi:ribosome maturation protein Sdo1